MRLRIIPVSPDARIKWRDIHNAVIPAHPLNTDQVLERLTRNLLTLAYNGGELVGNGTIRPPQPDQMTATVIVRILPEYRRQGLGSEYLAAFALRHGFAEFDRYVLDGETTAYVDLYLAT